MTECFGCTVVFFSQQLELVTRGWWWTLSRGIFARLRHDSRAERGMAGENAKIANCVKARRRHCRAKTHQQVLGREDQTSASVLPRFLELQQQRAVWALSESLLRNGRP